VEIITYTGGSVQTNGYLIKTESGIFVFDAPEGINDFIGSKNLIADHLFLTHQHFDHVEDADIITAKKYSYADYDPDLVLDQRAREWGLAINVPPFSMAFHFPSEGALFGGDALFAGGVGRTDLPHGEHDTLMASIVEKLYTLPKDTRVFPGHGPATTIGQEKRSNPFIRG
jgi:hydroxyacylglutathione hydrolase